jgi:cytochrome c6
MKVRIMVAIFLLFALTGIASAESAAAGKSLFTSKCALCHGADGTGNTTVGKNLKIKNLHSPDVQNQSDADLKAVITTGKNKMPPFKGKLTDAQFDQVLAYVRQLGKP